MKRLGHEFVESCRIAYAQIAANRTRSALTALGVIIGIVAVTLMGTAIGGIETGFNNSMALLGDDILYVSKVPWTRNDEDWHYRNRRDIKADYADRLQTIIDATPRSQLLRAVPSVNTFKNVLRGDYQVSAVFTLGTTDAYQDITQIDFKEGRFFDSIESRGARNVCVLGYDVANALFPAGSPLDQLVRIGGQNFKVVGVFARQGSFLGLFSWDNQVVLPISAFKRYFKNKDTDTDVRMKVRDKEELEAAKFELIGYVRRLRGLLPDQEDDFAINAQESFRGTLGVVKTGIAIAGLFITGLALFVGAIGIMNITFVSVKERTKEIGTRKALGARRRTILLQFLIEAVAICVLGGLLGIGVSWLLFQGIGVAFPSFPIQFSFALVLLGLTISVLTGVLSGFAPAWSASRLDPVIALRYE
ncbi:MAG: ABC transporter permease [Verrucomicrobia bacterium]|nr:ABC transporter permease [Verrucomicrobiota bacterium]